MISVQEADTILNQNTVDFGIEVCPLANAQQCVLREAIYSDRDLPPFDRVAMDGIAILAESFVDQQQIFFCQNQIQRAGHPPLKLNSHQNCIEVMTGAVLPQGVDTVIKFEDTTKTENGYKINLDTIKPKENIHFQASDLKQGQELLKIGTPLFAPQIGILASVGKSNVLVSRKPKILLISTGNELVDVEETPLLYQIRKSNIHSVEATLKKNGFHHISKLHLLDDKNHIKQNLQHHMENNDVFILSGGVSMGKFDFIPEMLSDLGVTKHFHKINQKPGKPFLFGTLDNQKIFYALPGNPISSLICLYRYTLPHLLKCMQTTYLVEKKILKDDWVQPVSKTLFQAVYQDSENMVKRLPYNGSGDYASLAYSTGFIEKPENVPSIKSGATVNYYNW